MEGWGSRCIYGYLRRDTFNLKSCQKTWLHNDLTSVRPSVKEVPESQACMVYLWIHKPPEDQVALLPHRDVIDGLSNDHAETCVYIIYIN